jgi:hypothetical protein
MYYNRAKAVNVYSLPIPHSCVLLRKSRSGKNKIGLSLEIRTVLLISQSEGRSDSSVTVTDTIQAISIEAKKKAIAASRLGYAAGGVVGMPLSSRNSILTKNARKKGANFLADVVPTQGLRSVLAARPDPNN